MIFLLNDANKTSLPSRETKSASAGNDVVSARCATFNFASTKPMSYITYILTIHARAYANTH